MYLTQQDLSCNLVDVIYCVQYSIGKKAVQPVFMNQTPEKDGNRNGIY